MHPQQHAVMCDYTDKCDKWGHFRNHYFKLLIFSLCGCRHLSSYLTLWNIGITCVRFVIYCGWHLNDLSNLIKTIMLIPLSWLDCTILCIKSVILSSPFQHLFIFNSRITHSLISQDLPRFFPSNRHAAS